MQSTQVLAVNKGPGPGNLEVVTTNIPDPPAGQARVRVEAAGVGLAFLQLAEHSGGVTVFGSASARNAELVRRHGATAIDYRAEDFVNVVKQSGKVDAVFDPIGGTHFLRSYGVLRRGGF